MATNEFLKESLEHFKQQRVAKLEEVRALDITIRQIQKQLGDDPEEPADTPLALFTQDFKAQNSPPSGGTFKPRPDEFFGMGQAEAARTYLEMIGHAMLVDDILKTIAAGGCKVGGADPKKTLSIVLTQNKRDFVPTGNGHFGLRKFYPNMPKLGRPEGNSPVKKAVRGLPKKTKRHAKTKVNPIKPSGYDPAKMITAVSKVLSDHKAKTPDEVLAAVEREIGHSVKKIAVYGTLRKKDFEQVGDKYRLRQPTGPVQVVQ